MPKIDLSAQIPKNASWLKIRFEMKPLKEGANLIARVWSGPMDEAVVIKGESGDAFVKLGVPQTLWYQRPVNIELNLKVVAYKSADGSQAGDAPESN
jgi:hypothetical protein